MCAFPSVKVASWSQEGCWSTSYYIPASCRKPCVQGTGKETGLSYLKKAGKIFFKLVILPHNFISKGETVLNRKLENATTLEKHFLNN